MNKLSKSLLAATGAVALGLGSAFAISAPAMATDHEVYTDTTYWEYFDDVDSTLDYAAQYDNEYGIDGWTGGLIDSGFDLYVNYDDDGAIAYNDFTETSMDYNQGGTSVWTGEETESFNGGSDDVTVYVTVTFSGNYVKYDYSIDAPDSSLVYVEADFDAYSDSSVCYYESDSSTGLMTTSLYDGSDSDCDVTASNPGSDYNGDPVGLFSIYPGDSVGGGWEYTNGADTFDGFVSNVSEFSIIAGQLDYTEQGGFNEAFDFGQSIYDELWNNFGESYTSFGEDFTVADTAYTGDVTIPIVGGDMVTDTDYLTDGIVTFDTAGFISGLPAGVTGTFEQNDTTGAMSLKLTGTAEEKGDFTPEIVLYHPEGINSVTPYIGYEPVYFTFNLSTATLPDTGASTQTIAGAVAAGASLLAIGAALLIIRKRRTV